MSLFGSLFSSYFICTITFAQDYYFIFKMDEGANFISLAINCITQCITLLNDQTNTDIVVQRLESLLLASSSFITRPQVIARMESIIEEVITLLETTDESPCSTLPRGRPSIKIDVGAVEQLMSLNFKATQIAQLIGISIRTLHRKLREAGLSVTKDAFSTYYCKNTYGRYLP
jgi:AraC-like DNA-binding protein